MIFWPPNSRCRFWNGGRTICPRKAFTTFLWRELCKTSSAQIFNRGGKRVHVSTDNEKYVLTSPKPVDPEHDPSRYDLFPTDSLKISGQFFKARSSINGIGAPLVAVGRTEDPQFRQHYRLRRVYAPVTAAIQFSNQTAELEFVDPYQSERIALSKRHFSAGCRS